MAHNLNDRLDRFSGIRFSNQSSVPFEDIDTDGEGAAQDMDLADTETEKRWYISFNGEGNLKIQEEPVKVDEMLDECAYTEQEENEDIERQMLISTLPLKLRDALEGHPSLPFATELVLDQGTKAQLRGENEKLELSYMVTEQTIAEILNQLDSCDAIFSANRCGIKGTLHRISRRVGMDGKTVVGFTVRFGSMKKGITKMITDLIMQRKSVLIIGQPGVGMLLYLYIYICIYILIRECIHVPIYILIHTHTLTHMLVHKAKRRFYVNMLESSQTGW